MLDEIERVIHGEDHPGDAWFIETIESLVNYVKAAEEAFGTFYPEDASGAWDEFKRARAALGLK